MTCVRKSERQSEKVAPCQAAVSSVLRVNNSSSGWQNKSFDFSKYLKKFPRLSNTTKLHFEGKKK